MELITNMDLIVALEEKSGDHKISMTIQLTRADKLE